MPIPAVLPHPQLHDGVSQLSQHSADAITPGIADAPSQFPTLFSRESWERYCVSRHGSKASLLAHTLFDHLARLDGRDDGFLDIHGLHLDTVSEVFGFGDVSTLFRKIDTLSSAEQALIKSGIRSDLDHLHHGSAMRQHRNELFVTKVGENRFFAVAGATDATFMITSAALNAAWDKSMQLHSETPWMRVVTHEGYRIGRTNNPADPDHQVANIAVMQADLLVTGGVGVVVSDGEMLISPSGSVSGHVDPSEIDVAITAIVGLAYIAAAVFGRGKTQATPPPISGGGGTPYNTPSLGYPRAVLSQLVTQLRRAKDSGRQFVTAYMGDAPPPTQPQLPYVKLNMNPIEDLLRATAALMRKRPSQPSAGFAPEPVQMPAAEPAPHAKHEWGTGVQAPTAVKRAHRVSGGFVPPHLPSDAVESMDARPEPTQPAKPGVAATPVRDTDRQYQSPTYLATRPTLPISVNPALVNIIAAFKDGLGRIHGAKEITVHQVDGTVYVSAKSQPNSVSIVVPSMTTLDSAETLLRHVVPVLVHRAPVPLSVKVTFEPELAFDSLCREYHFTAKAIGRAKSGGIVKIHMEGDGAKPVDFVADDAAVLRLNRITGGDLMGKNTMRIDLILLRPIVEAGSFTHDHMNAIKDQLMDAILRIDSARFGEFAPALQPLDY